jgi:RimJ/RimL family protein N-acetyltransferase
LTIKPLTSAYPHHIDALNDKAYMRYSEQRHVSHDHATQEVYLRTAGPDCILLDLVIVDASVGSMSCYLDHLNRVCDLGIMICPEFVKLGYGAEAWAAVMDHWLKRDWKVEAGMMVRNLRMVRICALTGMEFEGIRRRHFRVDDDFDGLMMWGRTP